MAGRIFKLGCFIAMVSGLAACASGAARPGDAGFVVANPAPIVAGTMRPYQVRGRWYRPAEQPNYDERGMASWYGPGLNGRSTASGERFDMHALTAAHPTLPLPGLAEVTNLANGKRVVVRLNDRGPFSEGRLIDLSRGAAEALDLLARGVGEVRVRYLGPAPRLDGGAVAPHVALTAPRESSAYWVQAGTFASAAEARRAADGLGERATVGDGEGRPMVWRVLLGPWPDPNAAEQARQAVVARGYADALLISNR